MFSRSLRMVLIVAGLSVLIGCDPETVVKSKVPEPLRKALTFGPAGAAAKAKQSEAASVEITVAEERRGLPCGEGDSLPRECQVGK